MVNLVYEIFEPTIHGWTKEALEKLEQLPMDWTNKTLNCDMYQGNCTLLYWAAKRGTIEVLEALLNRPNIEIDKVNTPGKDMTPLQAACDTSKWEAAMILLKAGANALYHSPSTKIYKNMGEKIGYCVLDFALRNTYQEDMAPVVIEILKRHPQDELEEAIQKVKDKKEDFIKPEEYEEIRKYVAENGLKTRDVAKSGIKGGVQLPNRMEQAHIRIEAGKREYEEMRRKWAEEHPHLVRKK